MSSRIRSRSLCSRLSRQGFPCSWCGLGAVLLFVMAYPPVAETSSEEIPVLFSTTSQEHTPFTFLQESGQNREGPNSSQVTATPVSSAADVTITIDPTKTKPISPWIYGINFYSGVSGAPPLLTLDRAGGNRWTAYNWVTNASNAGSDYIYNNDNYLSSSNVPAEAVRSFIAGDQAKGVASLVTFQLQGLVSADENGPVSVANPPDLTRFKRVVDKKSTVSSVPFTVTPPATDANVYMDEFL